MSIVTKETHCSTEMWQVIFSFLFLDQRNAVKIKLSVPAGNLYIYLGFFVRVTWLEKMSLSPIFQPTQKVGEHFCYLAIITRISNHKLLLLRRSGTKKQKHWEIIWKYCDDLIIICHNITLWIDFWKEFGAETCILLCNKGQINAPPRDEKLPWFPCLSKVH